MKTLQKFFNLLLVATFAFGMSACSNDDFNPNPNPDPEDEEVIEPIVFSYDKFLQNDDVIILDADTTRISISKAYYESVNREIVPTNDAAVPVTIWRTINTAPFVRNVTQVVQEGDRVVLTTERGDLGDVLGNDEFDLDSRIYVDEDKPKITLRGGATNVNPERYKDDDGVYHPAVVIVEQAGDESNSILKARDAQVENTYYTADQLVRQDVDFRILNVNMPLGDFSLTSPNKNLKIYLKKTHIKAIAGVRISVKTKWFKLKKFECAAYGDFGLNFTAGAEVSLSQSWKKEIELAQFSRITSVFWVGPVPVAICCNAGANFVAETKASASCTFETNVDLGAQFDAGVYYNGGWSNQNTSSVNASAHLSKKTGTEFSASASTGIELYLELKLYNCAGPKITYGPSLNSEVALANTIGKTQLSTKGSLKMGGKYGVELKIWKWKLSSWENKYTVWEKELWNEKKTVENE